MRAARVPRPAWGAAAAAVAGRAGARAAAPGRLPGRAGRRRARRRAKPPAAVPAGWAPLVTGQAVFGAATAALVGVYAAAVAAPRAWLTRWLVAGPAVYLALAGAMVGFASAAKEPLLWALPILKQGVAPSLDGIAGLLASEATVTLVWLQLLMLDLFQARYVHLDALRCGVPAAHSVVLCFMVGPLGLLSHLVTKSVVAQRRGGTSSP